MKLVALAMFLMVVVAPPGGATNHEGTVSATVTADAACITVGVASVDFGSLPFSSSTGGDVLGTSAQYDLTNCSTISSDFYAAGTVATVGTFSWGLDQTLDDICNVGTNLYRMNVRVDRSDQSLGPAGNLLTTSSQPLNGASGTDAVAGGASETVDNQITMPCTASDGAGTQASMAITYTAVLNS